MMLSHLQSVYHHCFITAPNWFRKSKEVVPSTTRPDKFDSPVESVEWLKHFLSQNGSLLQQLNVIMLSIFHFLLWLTEHLKSSQLKTTETYTWSKREVTEEGSSWNTLLDLGLTRGKYATDCVAVLLKEIKKAAINKQLRNIAKIMLVDFFFNEMIHQVPCVGRHRRVQRLLLATDEGCSRGQVRHPTI